MALVPWVSAQEGSIITTVMKFPYLVGGASTVYQRPEKKPWRTQHIGGSCENTEHMFYRPITLTPRW